MFDHGKVVNIYIVYEVNRDFEIDSYPTLENCLFGSVKLIAAHEGGRNGWVRV